MKPRQPPRIARERCQFLRDVAGGFQSTSATESGGGFGFHGSNELKCRECGAEYPLEARYVCERCFGPLEVAYDHAPSSRRRRAAPPHPGAARRTSGATPTSCRSRRRPASRARRAGLPAGCTPLVRADRLAERLGLREVWVKNDAANPTHSFKDRVVSVATAARRASSASRRWPAPRPATSPTRSPPTAPRSGWRPTSSSRPTSRSRRSSRPASTAPSSSRSRGNYDDVNRLCTELSGERELGVRQRQHAPVLRRGLQDARLRDRRAARLGSCPTASSPRSPPARCTRRSPRASTSGASSACVDGDAPAMNGAQAEGCSPGGHRVRRRRRLLPPGQARHDRQVAGDRQPGRRPVRARPRAPHRRRRSTRSPTTRSAPASACSPRRPGSSPRPPAA